MRMPPTRATSFIALATAACWALVAFAGLDAEAWLIGGFILAFSIAISAYATPAILGGPAILVMATAIYGFMTTLLDWSTGAALAVILVVCSLLLFYAAARFGGAKTAAI